MMKEHLWCGLGLVPLIAVAAVGLGGCQSTDTLWERYETKLASCQLIPQGAHLRSPEPLDNRDRCLLNCFLQESCAELKTFLCYFSSSDAPLGPCVSNCVSLPNDFTCTNGSTVPANTRCNGTQDYSDSSDEVGCLTFSCQNGDQILARYRCDENQDCSDGSDEAGCPPALSSLLICK
jgi:hypothetical protein